MCDIQKCFILNKRFRTEMLSQVFLSHLWRIYREKKCESMQKIYDKLQTIGFPSNI